MISNQKIELLRTTAHDNLVDVISDFVTLKKRGAQWIGKSPFSNERTPSFTVHPVKGIFKCFSSGKGGDCLTFLMLSNQWTFNQAAQYLGKRFGIDIDGVDEFSYTPREKIKQPEIKPDFIHPQKMLDTVGNYDGNNLFNYLSDKFGIATTKTIFILYHIGCIKNWLIYWQVDIKTFVRSGKYIKYLPNGHRDKESKTSWEHSRTKEYKPVYPDFILQQCFFGEHLLNTDIRKPIGIVESEKSAIVATICMPTYIWLACGSKNGLSEQKCAVLANRSVTLFPDLGCYNEWLEIARLHNWSINNLIEKYATDEDKSKGFDLADFLLY